MSDEPATTSRSLHGPRLSAHRDAGDAWVEAADGTRYWGRFGAAGLLVSDDDRGVLLQHRATWSHHGDTWGVPGGALHENESALDGACREAAEEGGVPRGDIVPTALVELDRGVWTYTTVIARARRRFEAQALDAESHELRWVPANEVASLPLHPGFGSAWPLLRGLLAARRTIIIDAANVIGARPDGWWRDRRGAARRLLEHVEEVARTGIALAQWEDVCGTSESGRTAAGDGVMSGAKSGAKSSTAMNQASSAEVSVMLLPRLVVVLEGAARTGEGSKSSGGDGNGGGAGEDGREANGTSEADDRRDDTAPVAVIDAPGSGDDAIVEAVRDAVRDSLDDSLRDPLGAAEPALLTPSRAEVLVVTSDRELRDRVRSEGAAVTGSAWWWSLVDRI